jgi:hypothetical protein
MGSTKERHQAAPHTRDGRGGVSRVVEAVRVELAGVWAPDLLEAVDVVDG